MFMFMFMYQSVGVSLIQLEDLGYGYYYDYCISMMVLCNITAIVEYGRKRPGLASWCTRRFGI